MEANELRLGNLVTIDNEKHWAKLKNIPLKITAINQLQDLEGSKNGVSLDHLVQLPNTYYETYSQYLHFIKPIKINEAWLKSLGFEKYNDRWWKNDILYRDCFDIIDSFDAFSFKTCLWTNQKIKYVHQLQNLFYALTGNELVLSGI